MIEKARPQPTAGEPSLNEAPLQLSTAGFEETQPQFGVGKPSHDKTQPQLDVNRPSHEETQHQLGVGRPRLDETQPQFGVSGPRLDKAQPQSSSGGLGFESALSCARWGPPLPRYKLSTIQHGALTDDIQKLLKKVFITNNYDSVNNFILFYDTYVKTGGSLLDFFKKYDAPLRPKQYTCVGLGLDLIRRMKSLECTFPGLSQSTSLLSCEESVNNNVDDYVQLAEGPHKVPFVAGEKEHVMVGVQIEIDGRKGVMIADPGYHVGKVVTVMIDGGYPHTGSFVQSRNIHLIKEYNYFINPKNPNYVEWHERQLKLQKMKNLTSLIFISRPFITAIEVSEKRNLVYSFKSHMNRDKRGNIVAGYFFPISSDFDKATFNVFIGVSSRAKYYFKYFSDPRNIPEGLVEKVDMISKFMYCSTRFLMETICKLAKVLADRNFVDQMLAIDNDIKLKTKARFPNADVVPPVDPNAAISLLRDVGMITNYAARLRYKVAITEADEDDKKLIVDIIEDRQKALEADFELENPNKPSCSSNR